MKTTGFLRKDYFGILARLFQSKKKNKSESLEELKQEITSEDYLRKVKSLIKQDLLLKYTSRTVQQGLQDLELRVTAEDAPQMELAKQQEPGPVQKESSPVVRMNEILTKEKQQEVYKVKARVPKWFRNPHQINSRILIAYMDLIGENKSVPQHKLESACRSIKTFQNNYNQMKSFGARNHAKVFEEAGGRVTLWEPVRDFILKEYERFKKQNK